MERWLPVDGYEGSYEVSNLGRIRSLHREPRLMRPQMRKSDKHFQVKLWQNGRYRTHLLHRIVLIAFEGKGLDGEEVLHRDGDASNNALSNLRWGTKSENILDQVRHGVHVESRKTHCLSGHPYDAENTYVTPRGNHRICRTCARAFELKRAPERNAKLRAARAEAKRKKQEGSTEWTSQER